VIQRVGERIVGQVEVQPALFGPYRAPGDLRVADDRAEQVQAGVHAHVTVTRCPVEQQVDLRSGLESRGERLDEVDDLSFAALGADDPDVA
jgi:hypothetical protein